MTSSVKRLWTTRSWSMNFDKWSTRIFENWLERACLLVTNSWILRRLLRCQRRHLNRPSPAVKRKRRVNLRRIQHWWNVFVAEHASICIRRKKAFSSWIMSFDNFERIFRRNRSQWHSLLTARCVHSRSPSPGEPFLLSISLEIHVVDFCLFLSSASEFWWW